jgi:hypothetical protein
METLSDILTAVIWGYIAVECILQKGIPQSISNSFYVLNGIKKDLGYIFTLWCWTVAITVAILAFELSAGIWYINLSSFVAVGGLLLVGAQPLFKKDEDARRVHAAGAILAGIFSILWALLSGFWPVVLAVSILWVIASISFSALERLQCF